ncbi:MAG TPA: carboxypeptidase-like regulatory domain-containing protein [Vicinamibacterales bacterium]|nr:carboxypeptidase-like regulatory domain-containing protein [Vicinamibacterales bacterium]
MTRSVFLASLALAAVVAAAQAPARVHGIVTDDSGGVLPGVTVTMSAADGRPLAVETTDGAGAYAAALPEGAVHLTFSLEGFAPAVADAELTAGSDAIVSTRLALAPRAETVVVQGHAPPAPPPTPPPVPAPPPPTVVPVVAHDRDSICGPAKADATPPSLGVVQALRTGAGPQLFAADDQVTIDGGTRTGLAVGQNVVARRTYRASHDPHTTAAEHTAGVLQIVDATERTAVAVVIYACDEIRRGDRLAPFAPEPLRAPDPAGLPDYDRAATILFGDADQIVGVPRRFLVIDRGRDAEVHAGQRVTLFRRSRFDRGAPVVLGDAVVVAVRADSATIRIERAVDIIEAGDLAAPQRAADAHRH